MTRLQRSELNSPPVFEEGGKYGAGVLRGVSLATVGEALGHEMWLDATTIEQITEQANTETGLKSRFTHPGMCDDGLGRMLGRIHDVEMRGEKAIGNLHFVKSAYDTPDGDLASYVQMLVAEDPSAAGLSIVFEHDAEGESLFRDANPQSPDERNTRNYRHVRLKELRAADIVDEPAANPDGMFDRSPLARQADSLLQFAAGLTETQPQSAFGVDGDRAKQFLNRFLSNHGLSLVPNEVAEMANEMQPETAPEITRESLLSEQQKFVDRFGAEQGVKWFGENRNYTECLEEFAATQADEIETLKGKNKELEEKFSALELGETEPVETNPASKEARFADAFSAPSRN